MARVFISGGTGYLGRPMILDLLERGHQVKCLYRSRSRGRVPSGAMPVEGDALDASSFAALVQGCDTFVHLTGSGQPSPWQHAQFEAVDGRSFEASFEAARQHDIRHFVYLSVAHPAPVMRSYIAVRRRCEGRLMLSPLNATILRPWHILGPGHQLPVLLKPLYALAGCFSGLRESVDRLGMVNHAEMVAALVWAVENPPESTQTLGVPEIRAISRPGGLRPNPSVPDADRSAKIIPMADRRFRSSNSQRPR